MTEALILRLDAPLMSFGGPAVDQIGPTRRFPGLAQIAGLLGNALGCDHREADRLQRLQARIRFASLLLRPGEELRDFQTVDLGQRHLAQPGWTTRGRTEHRDGGAAATGTHIRYRFYRAGASVLVALRLDPADEAPTLDDLASALENPARPLFVGRKGCLPAEPILAGRVPAADDLSRALEKALVLEAVADPDDQGFDAEVPADGDVPGTERLVDARDWHNQFHGGERIVGRRRIRRSAAPAGDVRPPTDGAP